MVSYVLVTYRPAFIGKPIRHLPKLCFEPPCVEEHIWRILHPPPSTNKKGTSVPWAGHIGQRSQRRFLLRSRCMILTVDSIFFGEDSVLRFEADVCRCHLISHRRILRHTRTGGGVGDRTEGPTRFPPVTHLFSVMCALRVYPYGCPIFNQRHLCCTQSTPQSISRAPVLSLDIQNARTWRGGRKRGLRGSYMGGPLHAVMTPLSLTQLFLGTLNANL